MNAVFYGKRHLGDKNLLNLLYDETMETKTLENL